MSTHTVTQAATRLRRWQTVTAATLVVGYAGYYVCRSNLSVATPLLLGEGGGLGLDKEALGLVASAGTFCYAVGKLMSGVLVDFVGGRRMFVLGMLGSLAMTLLFGVGAGLAFFVVVWSLNRLIQSTGWSALVKIASRWFSYGQYGTVMGVLSLSYLFGDVAARLLLGSLIDAGIGWRGLFFAAAAVLGAIALVSTFVLKESPADVGAAEPEVNPANLYGEKGQEARPEGLRALLAPFVRSPRFWLVLVMSLGLTVIREAFNFWTPTYLAEVAGLTGGQAGKYSSLFPFFGGVSVLLCGALADRAARGRRGMVMTAALLPLVGVLAAMGTLVPAGAVLPLVLVSAAALLLIGPYSFLAGAIALDLGGRRGSSTAAGLIDAAGYFGSSVLSGYAIGALAERSGWNAVFVALAVVALVTALAALLYGRFHEHVAEAPPPA